MPAGVDTILVAMGFCGGAWDHVSFSRKVVIPRVDDCISHLLQKTDVYMDQPDAYCGISKEQLFHMYFDSYKWLDIVDTGLTDCYSESYVIKAQKAADYIGASLDYVDGENHLLEKLVSGQWDEQFFVAEPEHLIRHSDFFRRWENLCRKGYDVHLNSGRFLLCCIMLHLDAGR